MEFTTYVNLAPDAKKKAQAIYASQLYGTFFGVFGQFTTKTDEEIVDSILITKIDFTLINYKGDKNLNIIVEQLGPISSRTTDSQQTIHTLKLPVKCFADEQSDPVQLKVPYNFEDHGHPNGFLVKKGDILLVERELKPMNPANGERPSTRAFKNGHFDSEFFMRDGNNIHPKQMIDIEDVGINIADLPQDYPFGSCTPGQSYILF